jgi:hypothetical protein
MTCMKRRDCDSSLFLPHGEKPIMPCARRIALVTKHGQIPWRDMGRNLCPPMEHCHGTGVLFFSPEAWWTDDKVRSVIVSGGGIAFRSVYVSIWCGIGKDGRRLDVLACRVFLVLGLYSLPWSGIHPSKTCFSFTELPPRCENGSDLQHTPSFTSGVEPWVWPG